MRRRWPFWLVLTLVLSAFGLYTFSIWRPYVLTSPVALSRLPERMARIKPGTPEPQVWQMLGVSPNAILFAEKSGGRHQHFCGYCTSAVTVFLTAIAFIWSWMPQRGLQHSYGAKRSKNPGRRGMDAYSAPSLSA